MRSTSKFAMLVALALAAMAVAAGPASAAATVAEDGAWTASESGAGVLANSQISVSCEFSQAEGTVTNAGALTVDVLTFTECTETIGGTECTVMVRDLPNSATITHNPAGPHTGDVTSNTVQPGGVFAGADIVCAAGTLQCTASSSSALTGEITNGGPGTLEITGEVLALSGTLCGSEGTWNSAWTIDQTDGTTETQLLTYTDTTTTVTA
jgi:hypothetical protein